MLIVVILCNIAVLKCCWQSSCEQPYATSTATGSLLLCFFEGKLWMSQNVGLYLCQLRTSKHTWWIRETVCDYGILVWWFTLKTLLLLLLLLFILFSQISWFEVKCTFLLLNKYIILLRLTWTTDTRASKMNPPPQKKNCGKKSRPYCVQL
jgi:hypothetical protein